MNSINVASNSTYLLVGVGSRIQDRPPGIARAVLSKSRLSFAVAFVSLAKRPYFQLATFYAASLIRCRYMRRRHWDHTIVVVLALHAMTSRPVSDIPLVNDIPPHPGDVLRLASQPPILFENSSRELRFRQMVHKNEVDKAAKACLID